MLIIVFSVATLYFVWRYFKKKNRTAELELAPLDPRDIDYIDYDFFLRENTHSRSDKSSGSPQSNGKPTPTLGKSSDQLPTFSDSKPYVVSEKFYQIPLTAAAWKKDNVTDRRKCL